MFGKLPIVFDSSVLAERDRFAFAREEYGRKALQVDLDTLGQHPFQLRMHAADFGGVRVAVISSTPYRVARTRPLIADGDDKIGLVFPLTGRFIGEQNGREVAVGRGEVTTMFADRAGWFGTETGGVFLTIRAAPDLIKAHAGDTQHFRSGITRKPSPVMFDLIRTYLATLNRSRSGVTSNLRNIAGRQLTELAVHAFFADMGQDNPIRDGEGLRGARCAAALTHMARHFADPGYNVGVCAGQLGISVRSLQLLLEADGKRFSDELRRLRLERAHTLLSDPRNAAFHVTDIALDCGFSDLSHFNRQFRLRFGETPTSVRASKDPPAGHISASV